MSDGVIKKTLDNISAKVTHHTVEIKSLRSDLGELRSDFKEFKDENFQRLDKVMDILLRLDQERLFTFDAVKNIEKDIVKQHSEIKKIKRILKIA